MKRFTTQSIGVDQGSELLFSDFVNGGIMWVGHGPREARQRINYAQAFLHPPSVTVSVSMWDVDKRTNFRADLSAENIDRTGFEMVFRTWGDSRFARVRADWTAIGALPDPEFWQLES